MSEPEGTTEGTTETGEAPTGTVEPQTDWKARADQLAAELEETKQHARKHEERSKRNADDAKARADAERTAKTWEQKAAELEQRLDEFAARNKERSAVHALSQVRATIAGAGIKPADADGFLAHIPGDSLLDDDNEPDERAIKALAQSVIKLAGRITPDPDQGQRGGQPVSKDMSSLIRQAAGYR